MPGSQDFQLAERGLIALGGCVLLPDEHTLTCRSCGLEWGREGDPTVDEQALAELLGVQYAAVVRALGRGWRRESAAVDDGMHGFVSGEPAQVAIGVDDLGFVLARPLTSWEADRTELQPDGGSRYGRDNLLWFPDVVTEAAEAIAAPAPLATLVPLLPPGSRTRIVRRLSGALPTVCIGLRQRRRVTPLDADAVSLALFDEVAALPAGGVAAEVAAESWSSWHRPGLLSFWVDDVGRTDLKAVLGVPMDGHLLNWTAVTADGERDETVLDTLWGSVTLRLLGQQLSVLRYRLAVLLSPEVQHGSQALRAWLPERVHVVGHPSDGESAREVCERLQPPVPPLLRNTEPRTAAQVREGRIRPVVQAERRRRGDARMRRIAEVRAQLEARRAAPA